MADKKISALTAVADADIGGDDLLHIVDNPGGTPVNKKMTIAQLFENVLRVFVAYIQEEDNEYLQPYRPMNFQVELQFYNLRFQMLL